MRAADLELGVASVGINFGLIAGEVMGPTCLFLFEPKLGGSIIIQLALDGTASLG